MCRIASAADKVLLCAQLEEVQYTPAKKRTRRITPVTVSAPPPLTAPQSLHCDAMDAASPEKESVAREGEEGAHRDSRPESQQQVSLLKFFPQQQDKRTSCTPSKDRPTLSRDDMLGAGGQSRGGEEI